MLVIRQVQMDAFAASRLSAFEARLVGHLQKYFPEWSKNLGPHDLAAFVRHGIGRARFHGFHVELELARYLHVMQGLGADFDEPAANPWAEQLLTSKMSSAEKLDRLRDASYYHTQARRIQHVR